MRSWFNVPVSNALFVNRYLAAKGTLALEHAPYSSYLAHFDFFFVFKDKVWFKWNPVRVDGRSEWKFDKALDALTKDDFHYWFD